MCMGSLKFQNSILLHPPKPGKVLPGQILNGQMSLTLNDKGDSNNLISHKWYYKPAYKLAFINCV